MQIFAFFIAMLKKNLYTCVMIATRQKLTDKKQTAKKMYALINSTAADLKKIRIGNRALADLPLSDFYFFVKNIPYRRDPKPREIIARPEYLIKFRSSGLDCKKKAILMGAWAKENDIKYRLVATSKKKNKRIHHVFPQIKISDRFINTDATYNHNHINEKPHFTKFVVL